MRELFGIDNTASYTMQIAPAPGASTVPAEVGSIDLLFSSEPVSDSLNPLAVAFDGGYVAGQGSIDDLFAGALLLGGGQADLGGALGGALGDHHDRVHHLAGAVGQLNAALDLFATLFGREHRRIGGLLDLSDHALDLFGGR